MMPRNFFRRPALALYLCLIAFSFTVPARTENALLVNQGITKAYCASDLSGPIVYFSNILDADLKARTKISTLPLNFAFKNYLVDEYDFKSNSNYAAGCSVFETQSQAEANKRQLISQAQQAGKQVVEVNWRPGPIVETPQGEGVSIGPKGPPPTHTVCALGHQSTMYFSGVFATFGWTPNSAWNDSFNAFLRANYSAEGEANCTTMNTVREAERLLKDRVAGVRANRNKAVETGWKYDPTQVASTRPRPKPTPKVDDDPEPAPQRPAPPPPPADIRQFATKEVPVALAYCQNDRMVSGAFDCYCIQREVYNYRMAHASDGAPEPLADLFAKDKVNCAGCIGQFANFWATSQAQSRSLPLPVAQCVSERFLTALRAKPYPRYVKELFDAAIAACKR